MNLDPFMKKGEEKENPKKDKKDEFGLKEEAKPKPKRIRGVWGALLIIIFAGLVASALIIFIWGGPLTITNFTKNKQKTNSNENRSQYEENFEALKTAEIETGDVTLRFLYPDTYTEKESFQDKNEEINLNYEIYIRNIKSPDFEGELRTREGIFIRAEIYTDYVWNIDTITKLFDWHEKMQRPNYVTTEHSPFKLQDDTEFLRQIAEVKNPGDLPYRYDISFMSFPAKNTYILINVNANLKDKERADEIANIIKESLEVGFE